MHSIETTQSSNEGDRMTQIGKTAEVRLPVLPPHPADSPAFSPEEGFPAVVAMHRAASKLLVPLLAAGEDSVTVETRITHFALAAHGEVRAVATYLGGQDRRHFFRVHVFDDSGLIAEADHTRAVVLPKRLRAIARHRAGLPAMLLDI
jgi:predicted thioesterase